MNKPTIGRARAMLAACSCALLALAAAVTRDSATGQAGIPLSLPGQEDISFWVNHNGLLQFHVEGEVGFGDMARILMRRRDNGPLMRTLRDRFTFRVREFGALQTPGAFRAEYSNGTLSWRNSPPDKFVATSSRTFNIPVIIENRDSKEIGINARYQGPSMESTAKVTLQPNAATGVFLRAVETQLGPAKGALSLQHTGGELTAGLEFDVRPQVPLRVRIVDERGAPTAARVYLTGADGLSYAPPGASSRIAAMSAEYYFHAEDTFSLEMPAGETLVEATRGPEYRLTSERIRLEQGKPAEVTLRLSRWTHAASRGYWSADVHIHANYTSPHHQAVQPDDVRLQVRGEDLNYANMMVANSSGAFIHDRQFFEGKPHRLSAPPYFIYWNEENRSSAYGHMCFLGLKQLVEPFYNGFRNTPFSDDYPPNYPLAQQVYDQGGAVSYAHPGMAATFDAASIKELPVDLALGHKTAMDVLSNSDEAATTELWYRLLNCGFRVAISAGTDAFTNLADHYIAGGGRVYVQTGEKFDYSAWLANFRQGRSFASNGPMVTLAVDGTAPGGELRLDTAREVEVKATVTTQVPLDKVEILVNGKPAFTAPAAGKESIGIDRRIPIRSSAWIAVRALGPRHRLVLNDTMAFAHTSPVYVTVGGRPVSEPEDLRFYREWVERLIERAETRGRFATPERKQEVLQLFRKALSWYQAAGPR